MTAKLSLHVDQPDLPVPSVYGAVITVRQVADGTGAYPEDPFETVVVADWPNGRRMIVPTGLYRLEARLPNGDVLRESRQLEEDDDKEVRFDASQTPHEWLGWQSISGNVLPANAYHERHKRFAENQANTLQATIAADLYRSYNFEQFGLDDDNKVGVWIPSNFGVPGGGGGTAVQIPGSSDLFVEFGTGVARGVGVRASRETAIELPLSFRVPPRFFSVVASMVALGVTDDMQVEVATRADEMVSVWTPQFPDFSPEWSAPPGPLGGPAPRPIAVVMTADATLMAFLPLPWSTHGGPNAQIELMHDRSAVNGRGLRVSVIDGERAALLSYLGSSRMGEAAVVFEASGLGDQVLAEMLAKRDNPLAASAAAYVGLAYPVGDPRREHWSPWLENLMNWFPAIPDGAILRGRDLLDRSKSDDDLNQALGAFKTAYRRGPPFFSAGVRHLLDGLHLFAQEEPNGGLGDDEARAMHADVSNLALLTDPDQVFTVLKLRPGFLHV